MPTTTVSSKFRIVIPKEVRERVRLAPGQRVHVIEKGGVITLVPEAPPRPLEGFRKGLDPSGLREKKKRV